MEATATYLMDDRDHCSHKQDTRLVVKLACFILQNQNLVIYGSNQVCEGKSLKKECR